VDRRSDNATPLDVEIDPHCRRLGPGRSQTDFAQDEPRGRRRNFRQNLVGNGFPEDSDFFFVFWIVSLEDSNIPRFLLQLPVLKLTVVQVGSRVHSMEQKLAKMTDHDCVKKTP